eukprot:Clim_evm170s157 gene=Clim_evmTU170s157
MSLLQQYEEDTDFVPVSQFLDPNQTIGKNVTRLDETIEEEEIEPIFVKKKVEYPPPAHVIDFAVSNNIACMALENGNIVRIDLDNPAELEIIDVVAQKKQRKAEDQFRKIFLNPSGEHLIMSHVGGSITYLNRGSETVQKIHKATSGHAIDVTTVAWAKQTISASASVGGSTSVVDRALLGSRAGDVYELVFQGAPQELKISHFGIVLSLQHFSGRGISRTINDPQRPGPSVPPIVTGLHFDFLDPANRGYSRCLLLMTTTQKVYYMIGSIGAQGSTTSLFDDYFKAQASKVCYLDFGGDLVTSSLTIHLDGPTQLADSFGWLASSGIVIGEFDIHEPLDIMTLSESLKMIPYPAFGGNAGVPVAIALTEFHCLMQYRDRVFAVNLLNSDIVYEDFFDRTYGGMINLTIDHEYATYWTFSAKAIFEIVVTDEARDVWKIYLARKDYEKALVYAGDSPDTQDKIYRALMKKCYEEKDFETAASYALKTKLRFGSIALMFLSLPVALGQSDDQEVAAKKAKALRKFLLGRIHKLQPDRRAQLTMLSAWLLDLFLAAMDAIELRDLSGGGDAFEKLQTEYRKFMHDERVKQNLHDTSPELVYELIESHGRNSEMMHFAEIIHDYEKLLWMAIMDHSPWKALELLKQYAPKQPSLVYKFSPSLIESMAEELVTLWLRLPELNSVLLIRSIVQYDSLRASSLNQNNPILRYLQVLVEERAVQNPTIVNFYIEHLAKLDDEYPMLRFVMGAAKKGIKFDQSYALRMAGEYNKQKVCIELYRLMGMYRMAVTLAVDIDIATAKEVINSIFAGDEDKELIKGLWLIVALHVAHNNDGDHKMALQLLKETKEIGIADILPFFPDFVTLADVKDTICESLEGYRQDLESIKQEISEATHTAELLRSDIQKQRNKFVVVAADNRCNLCHISILVRPFYVFPCQHFFHADCLREEVMKHMTTMQKFRLAELDRKLVDAINLSQEQRLARQQQQQMMGGSDMSLAEGESLDVQIPAVEQYRTDIDNLVASDCVLCGDIMIKSIDMPFIDNHEAQEIASWRIHTDSF